MIRQTVINKISLIPLILFTVMLVYILRINPIFAVLFASLFFYIDKQRQRGLERKYNLLNICLLFVIFLTVGHVIIEKHINNFFIPFSVIPMLATILFSNLEIALLLSVAQASLLTVLPSSNPYLGILALVSGVVSGLLVMGIRRRSQIIRAGFFVGIIQMLCLWFIEFFRPLKADAYLILFINGLISAVIVAGVLPVFEYLFGVVTNISLLEFSDLNHPLLRTMILKAPGTYHHSLVVGNLSEQACEVIPGANSLLARIGAYYHDIGKIEKAEYFSENQAHLSSKHDILTPSMSKLVIMNHVREGVELAKKYRLNPGIINFIQQHHGDSLVYYFYRRALESLEEDQRIQEEGFRYSGPKPNSRETAIVLLADSVEAACRAVKNPTPSNIEEVVHKIINNKFIDGQLDECDLTLKDLERIAVVFIRVLGGIYHPRITYPEKESESSNTKSSKDNSHRTTEDKAIGS